MTSLEKIAHNKTPITAEYNLNPKKYLRSLLGNSKTKTNWLHPYKYDTPFSHRKWEFFLVCAFNFSII